MIGIKRGDIYYADLSPVVGSEQGGVRPVLIIQNDMGNKHSPTVIAAAITSRMGKTKLPTHIEVYAQRAGLARDSVVLLEQLRTLDKRRLKEKMGHLDEVTMGEIDAAIAVSLGLAPHGTRSFSHTVMPSFVPSAAVASVSGAPMNRESTPAASETGVREQGGAAGISQAAIAQEGGNATAKDSEGGVQG